MPTYGTGEHQYELVEDWGDLPEVRALGNVSLVVDNDDQVHLFSRHSLRKAVLDASGRLITEEETPLHAHGLMFDPADNLYLVSRDEHVVAKYGPDGALLACFGEPGMPSNPDLLEGYAQMIESPLAQTYAPFAGPTDIALAPDGSLFIVDGYGNARVHHYTADGQHLSSWGEPGRGPGQFHIPHGVWVHGDGRVFVADRENDRVQIFDSQGKLLSVWTDLIAPGDVVIDADDIVYIPEGVPHKPTPPSGFVSLWTVDGELVSRWGGSPGAIAHSLCVASDGSIYVNQALGSTTVLKYQRV